MTRILYWFYIWRERACARRGHDWTEWHVGWLDDERFQSRECNRCHWSEVA